MNRAVALAKFEFMSNFNLKADAISIGIIAIVLFLRVWAVESIQDKTPINIGLLLSSQQLETVRNFKSVRLKEMLKSDNEDEFIEMLKSGELDAYIDLCKDCDELTLNVYSIVEIDAKNYVQSISSQLSDALIAQHFSIPVNYYNQIKEGFNVKFINESSEDLTNLKIVNNVFMILVCISVLSAFSLLLQGITVEKEEKITEMYMSTMKVHEWVDGKVLAALGISAKGLVLYFIFAIIGLEQFGLTDFTQNDLNYFISQKAIPLLISFTLGFIFWCYLYAYISVLIDKSSISIKNAAVLFPMAAFGIIFSISDFVSSPFYDLFSYFPLTYIFALPNKIMSSDFGWTYLLMTSFIQLLAIFLVRRVTHKHLKFI
ncbi:hypothetical protein CWB58_18850 [Pseudoalteromonas sp. S201]|jgi:hypothetical protein|uniref:ABC transporter permease n=1 Tax=Pseudoalteromonas sp. S201 TaxID=579519 RepID=UPI00110CACF0|nr:ABC transporter permease [Pseudoalteromonas sp. S201]TMS91559.1 hypothetical protein CWB58_18850 [Pseudoalteromonas sp. S201]